MSEINLFLGNPPILDVPFEGEASFLLQDIESVSTNKNSYGTYNSALKILVTIK